MSRFGHKPPPSSTALAPQPAPPAPAPAVAQSKTQVPETDGELLYLVLCEAVQDAPMSARMDAVQALNEGSPYQELPRAARRLFEAAAEEIFEEDEDDDEEDEDGNEDEEDEG